MTNIKNIYCIDINWIDNQILYYSSGGYGQVEESEIYAKAKLELLQELKSKLKPITSLIEGAFDMGIKKLDLDIKKDCIKQFQLW